MHLEKLSEQSEVQIEKPLQFVEPGLYLKLKQELAFFNLHSFDVKAGAIANQEGITIMLRYGEGLPYLKEHHFNWEVVVKENGAEISLFFHSIGEDIKKALIADYFKMMKP